MNQRTTSHGNNNLSRQNGIGLMFSLNKSSAVMRNHTLRDLILGVNQLGSKFSRLLVLGGYLLERCSSIAQPKLTSEPPNGSNDDSTNPYECNQTLYVSAVTSKLKCKFKPHSLSNERLFTDQFNALFLSNTCVHDHSASLFNDGWSFDKTVRPRSSSKMFGQNSSDLVLHLEDVWTKRVQTSSLLHDNIIPKPDLALELDPEPVQEDQTGSNSGKLHVSLAGPNPEHMDDEFLATAYPKVHENLKLITDEREKSKVIEESDSTIPDPSHQTVTSTLPVIAPFTDVSSTKPSKECKIEQRDSEVKKTDHSTDVLASIKSQVPNVSPIKESESEKIQKDIIRIKKGTREEKQDSTYSIRSTDKVALEEFDLKIKVKDHKRKHDSDDEEDDDDDEGPSAGSHQGRSAKRRRPESATSGSAQAVLRR
ncbi:hypothetical protein Tco_1440100 [Tanacetum coccineum]